ncbi:hypothetical protein [Leptothoe spongobia]|uniref:Uncharacterized protein n=1 Tax=Leptothoe spongobia TAU-MAC 1115 TaxID=1967444 RepID=A0A947DJ51_9CYAN|nr:hypothetical protein [Leptothoe spongobia]MBT9317385.1 hypothetical protein [Leptothoe spongobia TAU-MAC 1115]
MQLFYSEQSHKSTSPTFRSELRTADNWLIRAYQVLKQWLIVENEISVKQVVDYDGNIWWEVCDPYTRQQKWMASEEEVLVWVDTYRHRANITDCKTS